MRAIFGLDVPNELLGAEYEVGATIKDIGKKYGRSQATIRIHLKAVGCVMRTPRAHKNRIQDAEMKRGYESGATTYELGKKYGCSASTINKRLVTMGCTIRSPGTEEHRRMMSAVKQGISYDEWESYAVTNNSYCPKFDDKCRESNREKYGNRCFLCGKPKDVNGYKLSVHHVDLNKNQGCDGHAWRLVPLCGSCYGVAHSDTWKSRIEYLLCYTW
jgi:hypothetical protein